MLKRTAAVIGMIVIPVAGFAEGDPDQGAKVFRKCKACHAVGEGAEHKVGPQLNNTLGRPVAAKAEFGYSDTLKEMGAAGEIWSADMLDGFLTSPKKYARGTKMAFPGLRKDSDRADVIAYLATFSEPPAAEE